ncbi:MAG: hypothetical protein IT388_05715 [Nitrospirales bacterium]|nr:hypothetical protein [Nitrospirales bacterium]
MQEGLLPGWGCFLRVKNAVCGMKIAKYLKRRDSIPPAGFVPVARGKKSGMGIQGEYGKDSDFIKVPGMKDAKCGVK